MGGGRIAAKAKGKNKGAESEGAEGEKQKAVPKNRRENGKRPL